MVVVDVENRWAQAGVGEPLRGDGDVVEIAEAAEHVGGSVMARRARQREGAFVARADRLSRRQRHVHGLARRRPGAAHDRRVGAERVAAELGFDVAVATVAQAVRRPGGGQGGRSVLAIALAPFGVRHTKKTHQSRVMHAQNRRIVERRRHQDRPDPARLDLGLDAFGAQRNLHGGRQHAALELRLRVVTQMGGGVEGFHLRICSIIAPIAMTHRATPRSASFRIAIRP